MVGARERRFNPNGERLRIRLLLEIEDDIRTVSYPFVKDEKSEPTRRTYRAEGVQLELPFSRVTQLELPFNEE